MTHKFATARTLALRYPDFIQECQPTSGNGAAHAMPSNVVLAIYPRVIGS